MTDREALYRAILADPDDNTLRLIYADALEEESDTRRAAFVRTQVELANLPEYDPGWIRTRYHNREKMFGTRWIAELPALPDGLQWAREPFRRGLPASIHSRDATAFVDHADELFAQFPIESVELSVARLPEAGRFACCEWVSRLVRLSIAQGLSGHSARRLLDSPDYERLRELHIGAGLSTEASAGSIVQSQVFKQLTSLSYRGDRTGGCVVAVHLLRLADPPRLKTLDLSGNRMTAVILHPLLAAPALSALETLDLSDNNLRAEAVVAVASAKMPHLRTLRLVRTQPEDEGIRALAAAAFLGEVRSLSLGGNNLPPEAAVVLAQSPGVANLRVLEWRDNRAGDAGAAAFAGCPNLRNLVHLDLSSNLIEDYGADALVASPHLTGLIYLDLHGNVISPPAAARLKRRFGDRVFL